MALLFMDGFDAGDFAQKGWTGSPTTGSTNTRFNSGQSMYVQASTTVYHAIPASSSLVFGYAICYTGIDFSSNARVVNLQSDGGTVNQLNFKWTNYNTFAVQRNAVTIASATIPLVVNSWFYIEVALTVADAGGTCVVKINGSTVIDFTGDTRNGGTSGLIDVFSIVNSSSNNHTLFDDLYICDATGPAPYNTFLGEVRIHSLSPNGAGSSTQFTPVSGANYTNVDELPFSSTDYVTNGTVGQLDLYTVADLPATAGTVLAVQNNVIAKKTDAAIIGLRTALKSGATTYYGTASNLGTMDTNLRELYTADPATGSGWTETGVNSIEAGFEVA